MQIFVEREYMGCVWRRFPEGVTFFDDVGLAGLARRCWILLGVEEGMSTTQNALVAVWVEGVYQGFSIHFGSEPLSVQLLGEGATLEHALEILRIAADARASFKRGVLSLWNRGIDSRNKPLSEEQNTKLLAGSTDLNRFRSLTVGEADLTIRMTGVVRALARSPQNVHYLSAMKNPTASSEMVTKVLREVFLERGHFSDARFMDHCLRLYSDGMTVAEGLACATGQRNLGAWLDGRDKMVPVEIPNDMGSEARVLDALGWLIEWGMAIRDMDGCYRSGSATHVCKTVLTQAAVQSRWGVAFALVKGGLDDEGIVRRGLPVPLCGLGEDRVFPSFTDETLLGTCLVGDRSYPSASAARWGAFLSMGEVEHEVSRLDVFDVLDMGNRGRLVILPEQDSGATWRPGGYLYARPLETYLNGRSIQVEDADGNLVSFAECRFKKCECYGVVQSGAPHGCVKHGTPASDLKSWIRQDADRHPIEMGFMAALVSGFGRLPDGQVTLVNVPGFGLEQE